MAADTEVRAGLVTFFRRLTVRAAGGVGKYGLDVVGSTVFSGAWPLIKAAVDPVISLLQDQIEERIDTSPAAAEQAADLLAVDDQLQLLLRDGLVRQLALIDASTRESNEGVQALLALIGGVGERLDDIDGRLIDLGGLLESALDGDGVRLSEASVARVAAAVRRELARSEHVVGLVTGTAELPAPGRQMWFPVGLVDRQVARVIARAGELLQAGSPARALDELGDGELLLGELLRKMPSSPRLQLLAGYLKGKAAQAHVARGNREAAGAELAGAVDLFDTVIHQSGEPVTDQEAAEAINGLGGAFAALGQHAQALPLHRQAAQLAPDYVYAWHDVLAANINLLSTGAPVDVTEMRSALDRVDALVGEGIPGIDETHLALLRSYVEPAERAAAAGLPPGPEAIRILELTAQLDLVPDDRSRVGLLEERAGRYLVLNRVEEALRDVDAVFAVDDARVPALRVRAFAHLNSDRAGRPSPTWTG